MTATLKIRALTSPPAAPAERHRVEGGGGSGPFAAAATIAGRLAVGSGNGGASQHSAGGGGGSGDGSFGSERALAICTAAFDFFDVRFSNFQTMALQVCVWCGGAAHRPRTADC